MDDQGLFYADGINGSTGGYLLDPITPEALVEAAAAGTKDQSAEEREILQHRAERDAGSHFGVAEGIDRADLSQTGWGVIFAAVKPGSEEEKLQAAIRDALQPLLRHRQSQAAKGQEKFYRDIAGRDGYRPGETNQKFLARLGVDAGAPADPEFLPYYLLLVGAPSEIPFSFQYQLDVTYAVGRIHFETVEEYANYARSVVEAETRPLRLSRDLAFFGVLNPNDGATKLSREQLVAPLSDVIAKDRQLTDWKLSHYYDELASKDTLGRLLNRGETPAMLFTASHGMGFNADDARLRRHQGALLCSDWKNPRPYTPIADDVYFSGDDLSSDARLHGLIAFNFACYGGGTPEFNEYSHLTPGKDRRIAERPFVSGLHQKLLGHPRGGALAAIGHIERAWSDSLPTAGGSTNRLGVFRSALKVLMKGEPVGAAMEYFNARYAQLGADMSSLMEKLEWEPELKAEVAKRWTAHNDARDYVVNGDPAVRLVFGDADGKGRERELLELRANVPATAPVTATAPSAPTTPTESAAGAALESSKSFGFFGGDSKPAEVAPEGSAVAEVKRSPLEDFAGRVIGMLGKALEDASQLEVRTYVSNTASAVPVTDATRGGAQLRAWTSIKIDGDIDVCVPQTDGQVDTALWALHVDMVKQAQQHRTELIKTLLASVSGFFKP